ncbi:hypothetical protein OAF83_02495 [Rubripirellula sp.]|nr:hypothetical protein [Rubripirellula sp.]MDB4749754.1 hypothetical protein [Rubripirellula sp.]
MKSFGVRLAAGAGTILVVAYAIALAQKDTQAVSDTWNAETAVASNPAVPIGNGEPPAWLEQPDTQMTDQQQALAFDGSTTSSEASNPIEQVNYDQGVGAAPVFAMAGFNKLPGDSTSEPQATVIATPQVPLPSESALAAENPTATGGAFSNPASGIQPEAAANLALPASDPTGFATPTFDTPANSPQEIAASSPALPTGFGVTTPTTGVETASVPTQSIGGFPEPDASSLANVATGVTVAAAGIATAGLAEATAADAGLGFPADALSADFLTPSPNLNDAAATQGFAPPANSLRGSAPAQNDLRSAVPEDTFSSSAGPTATAAQSTTFAGQPNFPGAATPFASSGAATPFASSGASVMVDSSMPAATNAAPATFRTETGTTPNDSYAANPVNMVPPSTASALNPNATTDAPGARRLEGAQTPSVIIQKRAPAEVKVGKPAAFVINVRNVGAVEALDVEVHDRIPAGMRLADASPPPQIQGNQLMWQIGSMPAGDERTITLQLIPEQEGELGSVARVSFEAAASVRTIATRPVLKIEQQAPEKVLIGQQLEIGLTISNTGSGKATNIEIWEDVPAGLSHPEGPQLKQNIGTLMPSEVRTDSLFLKAEKPGIIQNTIRLVGDDGLTAEQTVAVEVIAPKLEVALQGPSRRFLERQAKYELQVANAGTAAATNVEISVQLSRGFTFVSTDFQGQYDPNRHAVFWSLAQLPAGANGVVPLTLLPIETGEQVIKINANADLSSVAQTERKMTVEGFADLSFSLTNPNGPIEIGAETTYDITVRNSGSKPDTNIRVQVQLPAGLALVSVDGDAGTDGNGLVAFQPKAQLSPGKEFKYRVRVRGTTAGTHIAKAVVASDQSTVPVTKEDTTRVYADQ